MCPRINIYPYITRFARGNCVRVPLALMDTSTEGKSSMIIDPGENLSSICSPLFSEMISLLSLHPSLYL